MGFAERYGYRKPRIELQENEVSSSLRNMLWNCIDLTFQEHSNLRNFFVELWHHFFKITLDSLAYRSGNIGIIREHFFSCEWFDVYELIEFIINSDNIDERSRFTEHCNNSLEKERSAYRIVGGRVIKMTDEKETEAIENTLELAEKNKLFGVKTHIQTAITKISDRKNPDYRNCIKESISAVESLSKIIAQDDKASLSQALNVIGKKIGIHPALKKGFGSIYGYTSDADGIRHALMDEEKIDFEDAIYMLVSCSAFINYLIMKTQKSGIKLN